MTTVDLFAAMQEAMPARRGNLYEQYFKREAANGKTRCYGPYYVWTRCEGGKMVSERVVQEDVSRVREDIARGKVLADLVSKLWKLAEDLSRNTGDAKKKKSSRSKRRLPRLSARP